jgi:hypothetical protein
MRFDLGQGTRNVLLNRENSEAAYRQSPIEHEEALNQFKRPDMLPHQELVAIMEGENAEKELPKYWNDEVPRLDLGGSSSWIDGIEYIPELGIAIMETDGREYYYPMTPKEVGDWMTSPSLGSYYNANVKLRK